MNIEQTIFDLEEKLLHTDVSANPAILSELLSEDFEEIGSNGKISSREDVINWLMTKDPTKRWSLTEFKIRQLSTDIVLACYLAKQVGNPDSSSIGSIRTSTWKRCNNEWKMVFHQATKLLKE